jgi:hypothetical protein
MRTNVQVSDSKFTLKAAVLQSQIINGAFIMGVVMTSTMMLMLPAGQPEGTPRSIVPLIACTAWTLITLLAIAWPMLWSSRLALPEGSKELVDQAIQDADQPVDPSLHSLLRTWKTNVIIRAAMLEGAAILCLVLWLISREEVLLLLVGASVGIMLATFPTFSRLCRWLENRIEER